jgi:hypothetical protein
MSASEENGDLETWKRSAVECLMSLHPERVASEKT